MSTESTVVLIHPGSTDFDAQSRIIGALDVPLTPAGEEQVRATAGVLRDLAVEMIYACSTDPCRSTAELLGETTGIPVTIVDGLENQHLGLWEGLQTDELRRMFGRRCVHKGDELDYTQPPEGEPESVTVARLRSALKKPLRKHQVFAIVALDPITGYIRQALAPCAESVVEASSRPACQIEVLSHIVRKPAFAVRALSMLYASREEDEKLVEDTPQKKVSS